MAERLLTGLPVSPGLGVGVARTLVARPTSTPGAIPVEDREKEADRASNALRDAAAEIEDLASTLRAAGRREDGDIVATGAAMAVDPALLEAVAEAVLGEGRSAPDAILGATESHARAIGQLGDALLAARAADIRSLGQRAARIASRRREQRTRAGSSGPIVLLAADLGPADVAESSDYLAAIVLGEGSSTGHAALVARSLGIPMIVRAGDDLFERTDGRTAIVDGDRGNVVLDPEPGRVEAARSAERRRLAAREQAAATRDLPAITTDDRRISVLVNAATATEVTTGLAAGAEGCGLIRTEVAFLDARGWPTESEHYDALAPVLRPLEGRLATIRVLDFGGDKTPPFLEGATARGLELLLDAPQALTAQLRAALRAGLGCRLRILLPLVAAPEDVVGARRLLEQAVADVPGAVRPELGAMIETRQAVDAVALIAAEADTLSIGTNDLAHDALATDRFGGAEAPAHDPRVLELVERAIRGGRAARRAVEVCGEAASDPIVAPLLVGFGADELSVGAARVGEVRRWVRRLRYSDVRQLAERAVRETDAAAVGAITSELARALLHEREDSVLQFLDGGDGIVAVRAQD